MAADEAHILFHREANRWLIEHEGTVVRVADSRGLGVLAYLIANPGRRFRALDLIPMLQSDERKLSSRTDVNGHRGRSQNDYRSRFNKLRDELRRAEQHHDRKAARAAELGMRAIARELAGAIGLAEDQIGLNPSRVVAEAIISAIAAIARTDRPLAAYLSRAVHSGRFFSYLPHQS